MKIISLTLILLIFLVNVQAMAFTANSGRSQAKVASTALGLKEIRKVGVGVQASGASGVAGAQLELNFQSDFSFTLGFGLGGDFKTFNLQVKQALGGSNFLPYVTGGFSRWFRSGLKSRGSNQSNPKFLADKFLNEAELNGEFAENIIYPGFGIQYVQSHGPWAGTSVYAEILLFLDVDDFVSAPVGSLGYMYYF